MILDIKDTIRRLRHSGNLFNISPDSNLARIADAMMGVERDRLEKATESIKHTLSDWAGQELDTFWGTILNLKRLPGVEDPTEITGDPSYIQRIESFMQAANEGVSIESVRKAAEAGAGIPFRINSSGNRVILVPLDIINAAQKQGALSAAYRLAPANCIVEISDSESYDSVPLTNLYSPSVYIGEDPKRARASGPSWESPNVLVSAVADKWNVAKEGSLSPGDGSPTNLISGNGSWHVSSLGFGSKTKLELYTEKQAIANKITLSIGPGKWRVLFSIDDQIVVQENITVYDWTILNENFPMQKIDQIDVEVTNLSQDVNDIFVRSVYLGVNVNSENRIDWLSLGGNKERSKEDKLEIAEAENILSGGEWISVPSPVPNQSREFYARRGGEITSALTFKTRTPGVLFSVSYSWDDISDPSDYPDLNWTTLPGYYRLVNGRVKVKPFRGKYIKLTFTNLRPLLLREYSDESAS